MAKFGFNDILNMKSRAAGVNAVNEYTEIWLSPHGVKPSESNFYSQENIEELADSFLAVGQQQPTVLGRVNGEYRIVSGHRRNLANIMNLERGYEEFSKVRYLYKDMTEAMLDLSLLIGNAYNRELTPWEKTQQAQRLKEALLRAKKEDGLEITGKLRDVIAELMNESPTNIARMDSINNNAAPEIKEEFAKGNIGVTTAYEAAKLPPDEQKEIAEKAAAGESIRAKEIAAKVAEKKAEESYETPHPESITSLCYSCERFKDCNVKTGTCKKCDRYIDKAEAEKTDEQRYNEEQDRIDRDTKRKLQEQTDKEKIEALPSDTKNTRKIHDIKMAHSRYEDIISGKQRFELLKNDRGYKTGDCLRMAEFKEGKYTGRVAKADIIYMLEDYTGIEDGYCIIGIDVKSKVPVSVSDTENTQAPLPDFRNNDQRKEWLRNYKDWGLWYEDEHTGCRFYKYDFENGARLIAEVYNVPKTSWYDEHDNSYLHLVGGPEPPKVKGGYVQKWQRNETYNRYANSETELVEFLKYVQKRK